MQASLAVGADRPAVGPNRYAAQTPGEARGFDELCGIARQQAANETSQLSACRLLGDEPHVGAAHAQIVGDSEQQRPGTCDNDALAHDRHAGLDERL